MPLGPYTSAACKVEDYLSPISHKSEEYTHNADIQGRDPEVVQTDNGKLGNLVDDKSVRCPGYVHPKLIVAKVRG